MGDDENPPRRRRRVVTDPIPSDAVEILDPDFPIAGVSGLSLRGNPRITDSEVPVVETVEPAALSVPKKRGPKPTHCGSGNSYTVTDADFSDMTSMSSASSISRHESTKALMENAAPPNPRITENYQGIQDVNPPEIPRSMTQGMGYVNQGVAQPRAEPVVFEFPLRDIRPEQRRRQVSFQAPPMATSADARRNSQPVEMSK